MHEIANSIAGELASVSGVQAVVLGGSHCTGTATESSDLDIGVYYSGSLDVTAMDKVLSRLDDAERSGLINAPGQWGKWINGGAWLTVDNQKVDILLRDVELVKSVIDDCQQGKVTMDFQAGHPFGFCSAIYMGEVKYCFPLSDPQQVMALLKKQTEPVSQAYRKLVSGWFLWEAGFSFQTGRSSVKKQDILYASGCLFKGILCLVQAVFAAHGEFLLNEKGALRRLSQYSFCPQGFVKAAEAALTGLDRLTLGRSFDMMEEKFQEISKLLETDRSV